MTKTSRAVGLGRFALAAIAVLFCAGVAAACPTCKDSLDETSRAMARGYFWSILFMISMPFLLLSFFGVSMYLAVRRARREKEALAAEQSVTSDKLAAPTEP